MLSRSRFRVVLLLCVAAAPAGRLTAQTSGDLEPLRPGAVGGEALRPGVWAYDINVRLDGEMQTVGTRVLTIDPGTHDGRPAWIVVEQSRSGPTEMTDSLVLDRSTLRPLRRSLRLGPTELVAEFASDSIRGMVRTPTSTTPIAAELPEAAIVSAGMLEALLRVRELEQGWARRADLLVIGPTGATQSSPAELRITGTDSVVVPAGTYDAWEAVVTGGGAEQRLWLSRDGNVVLRSSSVSPQLPGATVETVLTRAEVAPETR